MVDKMNSLPREQEKYRDGISIADLGGYGENKNKNKMEANMTYGEYDSMCQMALAAWKCAEIVCAVMGHTPQEAPRLKRELLKRSYPELFKFWEGTDLDPESKVMQDVFGGGE
jgi:hypothetical protein